MTRWMVAASWSYWVVLLSSLYLFVRVVML